MNIISNRPTHPNVIFIYTKIDPQNSTGRGGWEEATAGPRELGLGEAKGCVAYISPGAPFPPLCAHTPGRGHRQAGPSSRTPSRHQTPPNDASGVTTSSWHYAEMGLSPGPPGVPRPQQAVGVIIISARKRGALTPIPVSVCSADGPAPGLAPAPFPVVRGWHNPLSEARTRRKLGGEGRSGSPTSTAPPALRVLQPHAG